MYQSRLFQRFPIHLLQHRPIRCSSSTKIPKQEQRQLKSSGAAWLVAGSAGALLVAYYIAISGMVVATTKLGEKNEKKDVKFPKISDKTLELCQEYLSIVTDDEKYDSLRRIDRLVAMSKEDRQAVYERELNAIGTDEVAQSMTERNRNLLRHHLLHQQNLVRLLTCAPVRRKDMSSNSICSDLVGRNLTDDEFEEAKAIAQEEFQNLKKNTKQPDS